MAEAAEETATASTPPPDPLAEAGERAALDLQRRLELRRASQPAKAPSASKAEFKVSSETVRCTDCGDPYERAVVHAGERRVTGEAPGRCTKCEGAVEAAVATATAPARDARAMLERCGVNPVLAAECSFETFDPTDAGVALAATVEFVNEVRSATRHDRVRGLYLVGTTGAGKTHLAVAAAREIVLALGAESVLFDRVSRLVTDLQDTYGSGKTGAFLDRRERVPVLILDDLGTEKATDDTLRMLFDLINAREGRPTLVTSNLTPPELGARFRDSDGWARIASRLAQSNFRAVKVAGRDRRFS